MDSSKDASENSSASKHAGGEGLGSLFLLIGAIVIGALVGIFYGRSMWLAAGGPEKRMRELQLTIAQKLEFAAGHEKHATGLEGAPREGALREAQRLRDQVPKIEEAAAALFATIQQERPHLGAALVAIPRGMGAKARASNPAEADRLEGFAKRLESQLPTNTTTKFSSADYLALAVWKICKFAADLFLQMLKLMVIPLVVTSMVSGITSLGDIRKVGRVGAWTVAFFAITTAIAVGIGIFMVELVKPGRQADDTFAYVNETIRAQEGTSALDTLFEVVVGRPGSAGSGMFPSNIFLAASETNVLALIIFALVFGGTLTTMGTRGNIVIDFFNVINDAVLKMVHVVMAFAPAGILGLIAHSIASNGGGAAFWTELQRLGLYAFTVLFALFLHFIVLNTIVSLVARRPIGLFNLGVARAMLTAFSTSSSSATLPVSIECVEENLGISNRIAGFVLPLGATVNMNGTALYEGVAVVFIAQSIGQDLSGASLLVVFLTATLAAVGAPGIPQAGLVTMVMVLQAVNLPPAGIGTILAIDWFIDRIRTVMNVYGDCVGAAVVDRYVGATLDTLPPIEANPSV